ncbi:endolytic transglycosylase MltG [Streptomyces sp. NPDC001941]|uniref:endolytic transglycosylase MltG n=1 Tax=Streptomyces sp. NPDC001941 TaxID=3154659 RepID=UPI00331CBC4B
MTDYGRGHGSEPWHPTDPLYGDQGWEGQQGADGHATYGGQHQQQYPQAAQYDGHGQGQVPHDPYQQQPQHYGDQHYGHQGYQQDPYQQDPYHQQQSQQGYGGGQQQYATDWDTGQQAAMPYAAGVPADPYGGQAPDLYGTPDAYPPPQPPGQRHAEPGPEVPGHQEEEENHPFFTGADAPGDDRDGRDGRDGDAPAGSRRAGRGKGGKGGRNKSRKGKNGMACLVVAAVLVGGVGGVGYFGYQFWKGQFGAAEDYSGDGSGTIQVEIPKGAGGYEIGMILKKAGVVASQAAFVSAQNQNPQGKLIQDGVYTLKKEMSAKSAVALMLDKASRSNFVIPEGRRNAWVYAEIDKRTGSKAGTTAAVAKSQGAKLGLPEWATGHPNLKDPLEGFLFPASYPVAQGSKPEDVLRKMVARASAEYAKKDLEGEAEKLGLDGPWQLVTVASLVQAEGKTEDDFRKMAEVVYNRLKPTNTQTNQKLQFDSTYNYLRGTSHIKISSREINADPDPYNTYYHRGLPPGPIGNPGLTALDSSMDPTKDGWLYFVATDGKHKTEFAKTVSEFERLKKKFNDSTG